MKIIVIDGRVKPGDVLIVDDCVIENNYYIKPAQLVFSADVHAAQQGHEDRPATLPESE